jgi:hypothetical protein
MLKNTQHIIENWIKYCEEIEQATTETATEDEAGKGKRIARLLKNYDAFVQYYFPNVTRGVKTLNFILKPPKKLRKTKISRVFLNGQEGTLKAPISACLFLCGSKPKASSKQWCL